MPPRDPGESRPIATASIVARAWHAILDWLPLGPAGQWCEIGAIPAVAEFLAHSDDQRSSAGSELDLAKAYDSVLREPASVALLHEETRPEIVA